jgi:Carboxypeptidase regulatory-like domain
MIDRTASRSLDASRIIRKNFTFVAILAVALVLILAGDGRAQVASSTIRGTVTDQSGAVVPGAMVTATNANTGVSRQTTTLANGSYQLPALLPGVYNVTVHKAGFQRFLSSNVPLQVGKTYVVNAVLAVGSTATEVTVRALTNQINTTSMQLGATVTGQEILDLPLIGRDWVQLQQLQPGVMSASDRFGQGEMGTNFSTDGQETQQNQFLVNGLNTTEAEMNDLEVIPSLDAIGEFTLVDSTSDPQYARNSGAQMNAVIKSGTNAFHGDGYDFYRETSLDARNFFESSVAPYHENDFGATLGGPIWKNHTFFFFSYEGIRETAPEGSGDCDCAPGTATVFSSAERAGAWPGLATSTGTSAFPLVGDSGATYPAGTPYSTIFSAGTIPSADMNPLAVKLMDQYVPLPNAAANEYTFTPSDTELEDQYITRIDENFSSKDTLWGYWLWERQPTTQTEPFIGATLPGFEQTNGSHGQEYEIEWNHIFSPTVVNDANFGYYRHNYQATYPTTPVDPTTYGFTGILPETLAGAGLPVMNLTGLFSLGFSSDGPQPRIVNTFNPSDNLTIIRGPHTLKLGFVFEDDQNFNPFYADLSGTYTYAGAGTFTTTLPGADFLLGVPDSYFQESGGINNGRAREYYSYAQDEFKFRRNLTLTYGLAWDIETPYHNLYADHEAVAAFRPGQQSTVFPTAPTGLLYPGDPGINDAGGPTTDYKNIAPRVGFAWANASSKLSVHGGFGLYYNRTEEELALQNLGVPPTGQSTAGAGDIGGSPAFATPFSGWCPGTGGAPPVACSEPNKFPFTPPAPGAKVDFANFEPMELNVLSPNFGTPMSENYNLAVDYQISPSMTARVAYVGDVAHHLEGAYELNPAGQAPGVNPGAAALGCTPFDLSSCDPGSFPYNPAIFGSIGQQETDFNSDYNALQVSVNKNFSHGLYFLASYTWSHYLDQTSNLENNAFNDPGIDPFNVEDMWANSANDAPQRLVISYDYELPFYHFVPHLRQLTDGWHISGITTFQDGFPVAVYDSADPSLTCNATYTFYACPDRANLTGKPFAIGNPRTYAIDGAPNYWLNPDAFSEPALGTGLGDASRNPFFGPGLNDWDITLYKDIHITESKYFQLRFETYNTFNHTQFTGTSTGNGGGIVSDINNPAEFGRILSANAPREIQLSGKFYF